MTYLEGGQRVSKASTRLESYGAIDEVNSFIGKASGKESATTIYNIQKKHIDYVLDT